MLSTLLFCLNLLLPIFLLVDSLVLPLKHNAVGAVEVVAVVFFFVALFVVCCLHKCLK